MKIQTTAREIMDKGCWDEYCNKTGTNHYAINEGMPDDEALMIDYDDAKEIGLIK